jgi:subtilase family serine protease
LAVRASAYPRQTLEPWKRVGGTSDYNCNTTSLACTRSGWLYGAKYDEFRIGGTSLASPIFAGLMALADQAAGEPHGFANPVFYANAGAFYDVLSVKTAVARRNYINSVDATAGTADKLRTFDDYSGSPSQHTGPGWDNVTGLGTPGGSFLATFGH